MKQFFFTSLFILLACLFKAQANETPTLQELQSMYYEIIMTPDPEQINTIIDKSLNWVDGEKLSLYPDPIKFYIFAISACDQRKSNEERIDLLEKGLQLKEKSIGVLDLEYVHCQLQISDLLQSNQARHSSIIKHLESGLVISVGLKQRIMNPLLYGMWISCHHLLYLKLAYEYTCIGWQTAALGCYGNDLDLIIDCQIFSTNNISTLNNDMTLNILHWSFNVFSYDYENDQITTRFCDALINKIISCKGSNSRAYAIVLAEKARRNVGESSPGLYEQAIRILKNNNKYDTELSTIYNSLCFIYYGLGYIDKAKQLIPEIIEYHEHTAHSTEGYNEFNNTVLPLINNN